MVNDNTSRPLSTRQEKIVGAIVEEHVSTGAPVGSGTVREHYGISASTATIRNEMAELERRHYLAQPHISAGRIPLDRGYRTYVDRLMPEARLRSEDIAWAHGEFRTVATSRHRICRAAARVLSCLTGVPGIVMEPAKAPVILRSIDLQPVSTTVVRMCYETDPGGRYEVVIDTQTPVSADQLADITDTLARKFSGRDTAILCNCSAQIVSHACQEYHVPTALFNTIKTALEQSRGQQVYVDGLASTLSYPEYQQIERLRPILEALDRESVVRRLLRPASRRARTQVTIGHEHEFKSLHSCSSIACHYGTERDGVGALGVIGPTRLPYATVLATVRHVAAMISEMLGGKMKTDRP